MLQRRHWAELSACPPYPTPTHLDSRRTWLRTLHGVATARRALGHAGRSSRRGRGRGERCAACGAARCVQGHRPHTTSAVLSGRPLKSTAAVNPPPPAPPPRCPTAQSAARPRSMAMQRDTAGRRRRGGGGGVVRCGAIALLGPTRGSDICCATLFWSCCSAHIAPSSPPLARRICSASPVVAIASGAAAVVAAIVLRGRAVDAA
eukprot:350015-Chlamydomonas_euryale.AAC.6